MAAEERERATKKKLQYFLAQMLKMGCVKGFKYFDTYMRGREEMICTVLNDDVTHHSAPPPAAVEKSRFTFNKTDSGTYDELPLEQKELMLSQNTQQKLSGFGYMDIGLPPASPSEREIGPINQEWTLFLVAGYGKYSCPYVWVRSNHERLIKLSDNPSFSKDSPLRLKSTAGFGDKGWHLCPSFSKDCPLRLKSTAAWGDKEVKIWQIIAELVKLCTRPAPKNPFEVDMEYFDGLGRGQRVIALGAMAYYLQCVVSQGSDRSFSGLVAEDLREVQRRHLKELREILQENAAKQLTMAPSSPRQATPGSRRPGSVGVSPRGPGVAVSQRRQQGIQGYH